MPRPVNSSMAAATGITSRSSSNLQTANPNATHTGWGPLGNVVNSYVGAWSTESMVISGVAIVAILWLLLRNK